MAKDVNGTIQNILLLLMFLLVLKVATVAFCKCNPVFIGGDHLQKPVQVHGNFGILNMQVINQDISYATVYRLSNLPSNFFIHKINNTIAVVSKFLLWLFSCNFLYE